jgi:hypothetical protein
MYNAAHCIAYGLSQTDNFREISRNIEKKVEGWSENVGDANLR